MLNDIRYAARLLAKDRAFTLGAVLALVIGISATIAMITVLYGVFLRDLPFSAPDRIVSVGTRIGTGGPERFDNLSQPELRELRRSATRFDGIAAADEEPMDLADDRRAAERFVGAWVSAEIFSLLGHQPRLGRGFVPGDDRPGATPVVVLGNALWKRRYGSDPNVIGMRVRVNGLPSTVIGVMPERFGFPLRSELWQPLAQRSGEEQGTRGIRNIDAFGRLAAGATIAQAEADLARIMDRLARDFPDTNANVGAVVRPFRDLTTDGPIRVVFAGLLGAAIFLLLIACANVGNLLLARGAIRAREITIRLSLGATRRRIVRQLLAESLVLAGLAGSAGLAVAAWGLSVLEARIAPTGAPYWLQFPIDARVFAFVAAICLGTAVLCGFAPAAHAARLSLAGLLAEGGRASGTRRARRWTDGLVVVQLALSLTMLVAAGLMIRNVYTLSNQLDAGVDTAGLVVAQVNLPARRYATEERRRTFYQQLDERLTALPGMSAGITSAAPLRAAQRRNMVLDGTAASGVSPSVATVAIGPGYLETLGLVPRLGRLPVPADDGTRIGVVNERFAAVYFRGEPPVGRTIRLAPRTALAGDTLTIVGVVPDVRQSPPRAIDAPAEPVLYVPYSGTPLPFATIVVRSDAGAGPVAAALRQALAAIDPDLPLDGHVTPLDEAVKEELGVLAVFGSMFGLFATAALALAGVGLYAMTAYAVAQRTRELGLRRALGARAPHIWWVVTRRAALQLAIGICLGLAGALGVGQFLRGALFGVSGRDPLTLIGIPALMALVMLAACLLPAIRAMRVNPVDALRVE